MESSSLPTDRGPTRSSGATDHTGPSVSLKTSEIRLRLLYTF
jgi:hypothetical protein